MNNGDEVPLVRGRSRREIEQRTDRLVDDYYASYIETPMPMPVMHLFEFLLPKKFGIETSVRDSLPHGVEGLAYPRNADGKPEIVLLESVFEQADDGHRRYRFTTAHECGHGLMHLGEISTMLVDGRVPSLFRRKDIKPYLDPEWQAHVFAGCFLMPTSAVLAVVKSSGAFPEIISETFAVSLSAAETRISHMRRQGLIA